MSFIVKAREKKLLLLDKVLSTLELDWPIMNTLKETKTTRELRGC